MVVPARFDPFQFPILPKGINVDYPLSAENKALFAHPNDQAFD